MWMSLRILYNTVVKRSQLRESLRLIVFIKSSSEKEFLHSRDLPSNLNVLILTDVLFKENFSVLYCIVNGSQYNSFKNKTPMTI